jgi:hypothetical protein
LVRPANGWLCRFLLHSRIWVRQRCAALICIAGNADKWPATRRWWNPNDFKTEGENLETLPALLKRDATWMFRGVFDDCPVPFGPPAPLVPYEIPAEILERHRREREQYETSLLGPLPNHPNLTAPQAASLVKFWAHLPSGKIIHEPSRGLWASGSFDKHIGRIKDAMKTEGPGMLASAWASQHHHVDSMGWDNDYRSQNPYRQWLDTRPRMSQFQHIPAAGYRTHRG